MTALLKKSIEILPSEPEAAPVAELRRRDHASRARRRIVSSCMPRSPTPPALAAYALAPAICMKYSKCIVQSCMVMMMMVLVRLRELRERAAMTQQELAEKAELSRVAVVR